MVETQLLSLKPYILKLNKYLSKSTANKYALTGKTGIDSKSGVCQEYVMLDKILQLNSRLVINNFFAFKKKIFTNEKHINSRHRKSECDSLNSDWQHMFDKAGLPPSPMVDFHPSSGASAHVQDTPSSSLVEYSMPEKNFVQGNATDQDKFILRLHNPLFCSTFHREDIRLSSRLECVA